MHTIAARYCYVCAFSVASSQRSSNDWTLVSDVLFFTSYECVCMHLSCMLICVRVCACVYVQFSRLLKLAIIFYVSFAYQRFPHLYLYILLLRSLNCLAPASTIDPTNRPTNQPTKQPTNKQPAAIVAIISYNNNNNKYN